MDLDTSFGSKRRTPNMEESLLQQHQVEEVEKELEKEPLFLISLSSIPFQDGSKAPTSNVSSPKQEQDTNLNDSSNPISLNKVKGVLCDTVSGLEGLEVIRAGFDGKVETFGVGVQETCDSKVGFSLKEGTCSGQAIEVNGDKKGKKKIEGVLESKKSNTCLDVGGVLSNPSGGILEGLKGVDESLRSSLKIEVIDDIALLVRVLSVSKFRSCVVKIGPNKGKKGKAAYRRRRMNGKKETQMGEVGKEPMQVIGGIKKEERMKIKYSRDEMETLRFVNILEQRKLWRGIYTGFEGSVLKEYDDLASSKHQKDIRCKFNPRPPFGRKGSKGGILGEYWLHKPQFGRKGSEGGILGKCWLHKPPFGRKGSEGGILGPFVAPSGRRTPVNIYMQ